MAKQDKKAKFAANYGAGDIKVAGITSRYPNSEPNMQTLRPPMTDDERKMVEIIKAALRK